MPPLFNWYPGVDPKPLFALARPLGYWGRPGRHRCGGVTFGRPCCPYNLALDERMKIMGGWTVHYRAYW